MESPLYGAEEVIPESRRRTEEKRRKRLLSRSSPRRPPALRGFERAAIPGILLSARRIQVVTRKNCVLNPVDRRRIGTLFVLQGCERSAR